MGGGSSKDIWMQWRKWNAMDAWIYGFEEERGNTGRMRNNLTNNEKKWSIAYIISMTIDVQEIIVDLKYWLEVPYATGQPNTCTTSLNISIALFIISHMTFIPDFSTSWRVLPKCEVPRDFVNVPAILKIKPCTIARWLWAFVPLST